MDPLNAVLFTFGTILIITSWIQLMFASFEEDFTWGLTTVFVPFLSYLYGLWAWSKAKDAWKTAVIGWGLLLFSLL